VNPLFFKNQCKIFLILLPCILYYFFYWFITSNISHKSKRATNAGKSKKPHPLSTQFYCDWPAIFVNFVRFFIEIMKLKLFVVAFGSILFTTLTHAQPHQWPHTVKGATRNVRGLPTVFSYGSHEQAIQAAKEPKSGVAKKGTAPAQIDFLFHPYTASQIWFSESFNPGAVTKIEVYFFKENDKKQRKKTVFERAAGVQEPVYCQHNVIFEKTQHINKVIVYVNYAEVPGINQLGGLALIKDSTPFTPKINVTPTPLYKDSIFRLNDDVNGSKNPVGLVLSPSNQSLFFSHREPNGERIYEALFANPYEIKEVKISDFNLPSSKAVNSGLIGMSQDNNKAFVSTMRTDKFTFYEVYLGKNLMGKPKWKYEEQLIKGYTNTQRYLDYVMSYDGQVLIMSYQEKSKMGALQNRDLFVSIKDKEGKWSLPVNMGLDLNTIGEESPCFLAPDNKTLYFASNGRMGFGSMDIYVSRRLSDAWTDWSEPINIGPVVNTSNAENSFIQDAAGNVAYFVRWNKQGSNLFGVPSFREEPQVESEPLENEVPLKETWSFKPEPTLLISGFTLNKNTNEVVQSEIKYYDFTTGTLLGKALSNAETGAYSIILQSNTYYAIEAVAEGYLSETYRIETGALKEASGLNYPFLLTPIEKKQSLRLNNILFETDKFDLLPVSFLELDKIVSLMLQNKKMIIEVAGHTDDIGSDSYNQQLSQKRAEAVRNYLLNKGIEAKRVIAKGYGESRALVENDSDSNRALNRRVELMILETGK